MWKPLHPGCQEFSRCHSRGESDQSNQHSRVSMQEMSWEIQNRNTGRKRLIWSHSSARFCFKFSGNLNYRSKTVNSNMVNSKFHLIRSYCEIFFYHFPNIPCLKCTVNSNFHLIQSKTLLTNDFEIWINWINWILERSQFTHRSCIYSRYLNFTLQLYYCLVIKCDWNRYIQMNGTLFLFTVLHKIQHGTVQGHTRKHV